MDYPGCCSATLGPFAFLGRGRVIRINVEAAFTGVTGDMGSLYCFEVFVAFLLDYYLLF